ncbi:MAG: ABC transporter ATP-binding protein [Candidatus Promineifilaceae bacterium]|jgi:putative ABC transport system ATP-binding protein
MITNPFNKLFSSRRKEGLTIAEVGPVVCLDGLSKSFVEADQTRVVLDSVQLEIQRGQFVALLGHSGSGKSTLLNLISGIERPSSGHVSISDVPITELSERERTLFRRDHIGFVFQFFNLIPMLTVLENVTLPRELASDEDGQIEAVAMRLLQLVGMEDRRDTFPDKLSGGEQQRVAIARALVHDPMLVLADEPTGNLDENTGEQVLDLLLALTRRRGKTLIMATHNPEIARMADRIVRVHDGRLQDETQLQFVEYA